MAGVSNVKQIEIRCCNVPCGQCAKLVQVETAVWAAGATASACVWQQNFMDLCPSARRLMLAPEWLLNTRFTTRVLIVSPQSAWTLAWDKCSKQERLHTLAPASFPGLLVAAAVPLPRHQCLAECLWRLHINKNIGRRKCCGCYLVCGFGADLRPFVGRRLRGRKSVLERFGRCEK